ncbi:MULTISPECIES: FadR/GntR family transcriptional regulator [Arthrobacter]|uniref:FadR/GntR family transcriptional regulator n=1 Tax=Arthrobacter TaxID=1663 RepID=UPI001F23672A|nr:MULTISPECIES: FadR/GntR family transcriptional regulator [Arthrobacter]
MNLSDSRTAGQAANGRAAIGQPTISQKAEVGKGPATSGAVPRPAKRVPSPRVPSPRPLARFSAAEAVFSAIRQDIEGGTIEVGSKLSSEAALAAHYGVSRSVIREALRSCNALGLTVTKTGKGTFVVANRVANDLSLGQYSARDLNEARPHIEIPAAGLAARRRSPEDLEHLTELVSTMLGESDPEAWVALDASFHSAIARASGNKVFESVVADIREALSHQSETLNMVADRQHVSDDEHLRIVEAIASGDSTAAEAAMADHLSAVSVALDAILSK